MDMQATNLSNTTQVANHSSEISGYPVASLLFFSCGIIIVICNIASFILYMRYAQKNVHGIFVMSLCNGNSLIGLSVTLAASNFTFLRKPYVCEGSLFALSLGIIYNIAITFWISFNQFCIVNNLHYKYLLEKRRFFIIVLTAVAIKFYLILLFLTTQDSDVSRCESVLVFRQFHPFYMSAVSVPIVTFLVVTTVLYKKTIDHMKKLAAGLESQHVRRIEVQVADLPVINESRQNDCEMAVCSQYGQSQADNGPRDTGVDTRKTSNAVSGGDRHNGHHVVQPLTWHAQAQNNVRMILIQVTIYGTSLITGMIAASLGLSNVRAIINAITFICVLISPYQYVSKIPEVKVAMMRAFRCNPNSVTAQS